MVVFSTFSLCTPIGQWSCDICSKCGSCGRGSPGRPGKGGSSVGVERGTLGVDLDRKLECDWKYEVCTVRGVVVEQCNLFFVICLLLFCLFCAVLQGKILVTTLSRMFKVYLSYGQIILSSAHNLQVY